MTECGRGVPTGGIKLTFGEFSAALLNTLIREAGGAVSVSLPAFQEEAQRVTRGEFSVLYAEHPDPANHFTVRMVDPEDN